MTATLQPRDWWRPKAMRGRLCSPRQRKVNLFGLGKGRGGLWQPLDDILMISDMQNWDARYFTQSTLQIPVICGHNVTAVTAYAVNNTIISVGALVVTRQSFDGRVFRDAQGQAKFLAKFF